jgi:hypothetical protein
MAKVNVVDIRPAVITGDRWTPNTGQDPARYLINPGSVRGPNNHSAGNLVHARPYLASGNRIFVFPVGVEGFRRSGSAGVSLHKYLNQAAVDAHTFHREEGRIELSGMFPGVRAQDAMVQAISILASKPPAPGLILYAPGVFDQEQYVTPEQWDFSHDPEDRTHSIAYSITLVRTGVGPKVTDKKGTPAPPNPSITVKKKSQPTRLFTVVEGARTLRQISFQVYHNADQFQKLVVLNQDQIANFQRSNAENIAYHLPSYTLPTYRWPIGTKFRY